jgi:hypothetical protein
VGPKGKCFEIHSGMATALSPVFAAMIKGGFSEGIEENATLADTDENTFFSFCEFCYTGDYSIPEPSIVDSTLPESQDDRLKVKRHEISGTRQGSTPNSAGKQEIALPVRNLLKPNADKPSSHTADAEEVPRLTNIFRFRWQTLTSKSCRRQKQKETSPNCVVSTVYVQTSSLPDPDTILGNAWAKFRRESTPQYDKPFFRPYKNISPSELFTEVFLSQARLYVFGDTYDVESLRSLVIYKMRRVLAEFTLFPSRVGDIYALIGYTFGNTREGDEFRHLILEYAVCQVLGLAENGRWSSFYREQQYFSSELMAKLRSLSVDLNSSQLAKHCPCT